MLKTTLFIVLLLPFISSVSFYVLNDIHFDPFYDPSLPPSDNLCRGNSSLIDGSKSYDEFPLLKNHPELLAGLAASEYGQYGCDSPHQLIQVMLDQVKAKDPNPDIIYLPGDFVGHGYSQDPTSAFSNSTYNVLLDILYNVSQEIKIRFPNTLIIPAVGNNDPEFHYQVPDATDKTSYYSFLYDTWFLDHLPNSKLANLEEIKATFLDGGYYRVDYDDQLSIFSLNTVYFSKKNDEDLDPTAANTQLAWLSAQLKSIRSNEPNRKAIITYHILPGYKYNGGAAHMWNETFAITYDGLLQDYDDIIIGIVTAHTHANSIRAAKLETSTTSKFLGSSKKPSYGSTIVCPSVTPIYLNNPGFTLIGIEQTNSFYAVNTVEFTYLNLEKLNQAALKTPKISDFSGYFFDILVAQEYGLADFSATSIGDFITQLKTDDDLFKKFLIYSNGYPLEEPYSDEALNIYAQMGLVTQSGSDWSIVASERQQYICILKHIKQDDYKSCNS